MSGERKSWRTEAGELAQRFALPSGVLVTFVLFGLIIIPALLRERRAPDATPSDKPAAASSGWLDQAEAPPSKGKDLPPVDPATVLSPTPTLLDRGAALFKQNCTSCHGDGGRGDGPAAGTLNPKPRNFSQPEKWTRGYRITDIFTTITTGLKAKSATSGSVRGRRARPSAGSMRQQGRNSSTLRKALATWNRSKRS